MAVAEGEILPHHNSRNEKIEAAGAMEKSIPAASILLHEIW